MNDFLIKPIAEKIFEFRSEKNIEGTDQNDWEIAVEYLRQHRSMPLKNYCEDVFTNRLGSHKVRPLIPKGY